MLVVSMVFGLLCFRDQADKLRALVALRKDTSKTEVVADITVGFKLPAFVIVLRNTILEDLAECGELRFESIRKP